jgi:Formyl transferase
MNICFYTVDEPSAASMLNMHHVISQRPGHNYSFLKVKTQQQPKPGLKQLLKKIYGEWRFDDGRFDFGRDLIALDKRLKKEVQQIDHKQFKTGYAGSVNDALSEQFLKEVKPDIIIQAGAGILKQNIFSIATKATINLHHGIAPEIRGIESTFWCMYYGIRDKIGVTCHFIDATLDTGVIVEQQALNSSSVPFIDVQFENILLGREVLVTGVDILDKGGYHVVSKGAVPSYYFGLPGSAPYSELKKNNFSGVKDIRDKTFKMKEKKCIEL